MTLYRNARDEDCGDHMSRGGKMIARRLLADYTCTLIGIDPHTRRKSGRADLEVDATRVEVFTLVLAKALEICHRADIKATNIRSVNGVFHTLAHRMVRGLSDGTMRQNATPVDITCSVFGCGESWRKLAEWLTDDVWERTPPLIQTSAEHQEAVTRRSKALKT
jgi:hypothetical protein